jgi:hypothetical protein
MTFMPGWQFEASNADPRRSFFPVGQVARLVRENKHDHPLLSVLSAKVGLVRRLAHTVLDAPKE